MITFPNIIESQTFKLPTTEDHKIFFTTFTLNHSKYTFVFKKIYLKYLQMIFIYV